ncbi:MAG TPA: DNA-3-methyladenine glycosylase I [Thermoanaerobaculia bacterium]|jgi:DNA-3-methyladenine glycosylase I|nr:DNA-3-methyladenine glycosylase I [Thermoanaerobaculia bacterium]
MDHEDGRRRCAWVTADPLYIAYHDDEWGVPVHDERRLFEMLVLEGAQAGLSWITILKRREGYRRAFDGFDPEKVARFTPARIEKLLLDPGIIRNRAKVVAAVANARAVLALRQEPGGLDRFLWSFVGDPKALSQSLKRRGFGFVGPTVCYAFMQAVGMVNDHAADCFRYRELTRAC